MSEFGAVNRALTSLYAQRRGMDVTGQNITNVNTEGYSRQRADLSALSGPTQPALWSTWSGPGAGVAVAGTERFRDALLEKRGASEHGRLAYEQTRAAAVGDVEQAFGEPGDNGIQHQLADFWNGFDDIANNPTDTAARQQLLERANTLADGFRHAVGAMSAQWESLHSQAAAGVADVNATAAKVADLNAAIRAGTVAGTGVNDLSDQRDVMVQHLAELTGAAVRPGEDGTVDVVLPGGYLVQGGTSNALSLQGPTQFAAVPADGSDPVNVGWARDGSPARVGSGVVGADLDGMTTVLPAYRSQLDEIAQNLVRTVNRVHRLGTDATTPPQTGRDLFQEPAPPAQVTAATLAVALTSGDQIAATATPGTADGDQAARLAELGSSAASPDAAYRRMIVGLGVDKQTADRRSTIQAGVTASIDAAREATSGVNLDEEMANMLTYQHAYEAAGRYLSAVDSMLDTLINHTGV